MHPIMTRALALYRAAGRGLRRLRGEQALEDEAARRVVSGQSWDELCDALKAAGAAVSRPGIPADPLTQAEGYRHLTRLLRAGLEAFLEHSDPRAPELRRMVHETVKLGADNPDNIYLNATVNGALDYRIRGRRGSVHLLTFSSQRGGYGEGAGLPPTGFLDSRELRLEPDGSFVIEVSSTPRQGNWLRMEPETGLLIVRQTFLDRERETPAELSIVRADGEGTPTPLSARRLDEGLRAAVKLVAGASLLFTGWAKEFQAHANQLPRFDPDRSTSMGGDPKIAYYHSYFRLAEDEALLVEVTPPPCVTWNFQLGNVFMESLDYRYFRIHVNKATARYEPDGSVRIVVAHRDPGLPNWLTLAGHREGTMCLRWVHAEEHPQPRTRVVKLSELAARNP